MTATKVDQKNAGLPFYLTEDDKRQFAVTKAVFEAANAPLFRMHDAFLREFTLRGYEVVPTGHTAATGIIRAITERTTVEPLAAKLDDLMTKQTEPIVGSRREMIETVAAEIRDIAAKIRDGQWLHVVKPEHLERWADTLDPAASAASLPRQEAAVVLPMCVDAPKCPKGCIALVGHFRQQTGSETYRTLWKCGGCGAILGIVP